MINMASCKEIDRLVTDMNFATRSGRPSRNSQGICNTLLQPTMPTTLLPETPVNTVAVPNTPVTTHQIEVPLPKVTVLQSWALQAPIHPYQSPHKTVQ